MEGEKVNRAIHLAAGDGGSILEALTKAAHRPSAQHIRGALVKFTQCLPMCF